MTVSRHNCARLDLNTRGPGSGAIEIMLASLACARVNFRSRRKIAVIAVRSGAAAGREERGNSSCTPINMKPALARARHRFATTLGSEITDAVVSVELMSHGTWDFSKQVCPSHRVAAHAAEVPLMQAQREGRELTANAFLILRKALHGFRVAAASESRLLYQRSG